MRQHPVDLFRDLVLSFVVVSDRFLNCAGYKSVASENTSISTAARVSVNFQWNCRFRSDNCADFFVEFFPNATTFGVDRDDRNVQRLRKLLDVDLVLLLLEEVDHRERDDDRNTVFQDLRGKVKISLKVSRVYNRHDDVWPIDAFN